MAAVASSVAAPRTTSTSGIIATGLKKWKPTTREGCASPDAISVTESEEVFVASTQSGRTTASTSANTRCLTDISSNTASITKSASANASLVSDPVTSAVSRAAASALIRRPRSRSLAISPARARRPASSRAWSRSVSTTGTSSRRANSSAICAAISPAPTTPTLVTGRASDASGAPAACRARFWVRSKA